MDPVDIRALTRALVDIDSTSGRESEAGVWLAAWLRERKWSVTEQAVSEGRFNIIATLSGPARVVLSTHYDCVPPFFPSRESDGRIVGRGSCDAKGILAAQVAAAEALRASGETAIGLLFVVGEERGSDGARTANTTPLDGVAFLINGEPTDNRLGIATRGALRIRLDATGRAAHSAYPHLGESAIDKLLEALAIIKRLELPVDPDMGPTHYITALISGGVAPNVIPASASAELLFRTVGDNIEIRRLLGKVEHLVNVEEVLSLPVARMHVPSGFESVAFPYTTDVSALTNWGTPLLLGPGSIQVAHTDEESVAVAELEAAVDLYVRLARTLQSSRSLGTQGRRT
ncbi:MAG: M20/M25/M40 family metallo-hydrolase [Vicinamibacterales bacterium]